MLDAIIFDFDGVIADSEPLHYRTLLRTLAPWKLTFTYQEYLDRYIGFDDRDAMRATLRDAGQGEQARDEALIARLVREKGDLFASVVREGVTSFPGTVELIRAAADKKLPLAIASGATRQDIDLILDALGLGGAIDTIVSADEVRRSKPDPQTYQLALARLQKRHPAPGIAAGRTLAIEDTAAGITAARGAGLWTLGLLTTGSAGQVAQAHRAVPNLASVTLDELHQWFG